MESSVEFHGARAYIDDVYDMVLSFRLAESFG